MLCRPSDGTVDFVADPDVSLQVYSITGCLWPRAEPGCPEPRGCDASGVCFGHPAACFLTVSRSSR